MSNRITLYLNQSASDAHARLKAEGVNVSGLVSDFLLSVSSLELKRKEIEQKEKELELMKSELSSIESGYNILFNKLNDTQKSFLDSKVKINAKPGFIQESFKRLYQVELPLGFILDYEKLRGKKNVM